MPTPPTVAYLTRDSLDEAPRLNVYTNGVRQHGAAAPRGTTGPAELNAWADTHLTEAGYTRVSGWAQPEGFDKVLHDYKATVVLTPAEFTAARADRFTPQQAQQMAAAQVRTRSR